MQENEMIRIIQTLLSVATTAAISIFVFKSENAVKFCYIQ